MNDDIQSNGAISVETKLSFLLCVQHMMCLRKGNLLFLQCLMYAWLACAESEATGSQHCGVFVFDSVVVEDEKPGYCTLLSAFQLR